LNIPVGNICFFLPFALNASSPIKKSRSSPDCPIRLPPGRSRTAIARKIINKNLANNRDLFPNLME
jgi:hypothetical protein